MMKIISASQIWREANCKSTSYSVGLASKAQSNILENGKYCITLILIVPNSVQLKMQLGATIRSLCKDLD